MFSEFSLFIKSRIKNKTKSRISHFHFDLLALSRFFLFSAVINHLAYELFPFLSSLRNFNIINTLLKETLLLVNIIIVSHTIDSTEKKNLQQFTAKETPYIIIINLVITTTIHYIPECQKHHQ